MCLLQTSLILCRNSFYFTDVTVQWVLLVILVAVVPIVAPTVFNFTNARAFRVTHRIGIHQIRSNNIL